MSAFAAAPVVFATPAAAKRAGARAPAAKLRSVVAKAAYTVTLVTPEGKKEIKCNDDQYILDAAEARAARLQVAEPAA